MVDDDYVIRVLKSPQDITALEWDALLATQPHPSPFMRHAYLAAMHASGSATSKTGWTPRFLTLWRGKTLHAACALYLKTHSYGEYVFDWAWADAYQRHGIAYYPKALIAPPFTPVPGSRLLARDAAARAALVRALVAWCGEEELSSLHLLFVGDEDAAACADAGFMMRHNVQFHWTNVAPTLGTGVSSLPPEGERPALGRPGGGTVAPTLGTGVSSLPPEGERPALGRPGGGTVAPTLGTGVSSLPPEGERPALGRPGGGTVAPTLGTGVSSLPPGGKRPALGRPGGGAAAPTLGTQLSARPFKDFDEFLASLAQEKRKKIRQERRKVSEAGVRFRWSEGRAISQEDWDFFYSCYERTYYEHGNAPYLTRDFFQRMADAMPENWLLFIAERGSGRTATPIACSLIALSSSSGPGAADCNGQAERVAYGRYWGALERVDCLHFEACYYQPLEWCIANGYTRFEGGAQGEHKMARALMPVRTTSAHWLAHPAFADAVERFLEREGQGIAQYMDDLAQRTPFRHEAGAPVPE